MLPTLFCNYHLVNKIAYIYDYNQFYHSQWGFFWPSLTLKTKLGSSSDAKTWRVNAEAFNCLWELCRSPQLPVRMKLEISKAIWLECHFKRLLSRGITEVGLYAAVYGTLKLTVVANFEKRCSPSLCLFQQPDDGMLIWKDSQAYNVQRFFFITGKPLDVVSIERKQICRCRRATAADSNLRYLAVGQRRHEVGGWVLVDVWKSTTELLYHQNCSLKTTH